MYNEIWYVLVRVVPWNPGNVAFRVGATRGESSRNLSRPGQRRKWGAQILGRDPNILAPEYCHEMTHMCLLLSLEREREREREIKIRLKIYIYLSIYK